MLWILRKACFGYAKFLTNYSYIVLILSVIFSIGTGLVVYFYGDFQLSEPELGFETRNTKWSGRVLVNQRLRQDFEKDALNPVYRRSKRNVDPFQKQEQTPDWTDLFVGALESSPCTQFSNATAKEKIGEVAQFMSQVVYEFPSWESVFQIETVQELCRYQNQLQNTVLKQFSHLTPFKHFYSLPNLATCLTPNRLTCEALTQEDLDKVKTTIDYCRQHSEGVFACSRRRISQTSREDRRLCRSTPEDCRNPLIQDLFYMVLSNSITADSPEGPFYVNSLFPILTYQAYRIEGKHKVTLDMFIDVYEEMKKLDASLNLVKTKGIFLNIKYSLFNLTLRSDIRWGVLSFVLINALVLIYSMSIYFMIIVDLCLVVSILLAYSCYKFIIGIDFFPFINLLSLVLLIGIGADDTFILNFIFARSKSEDEENAVFPDDDIAHTKMYARTKKNKKETESKQRKISADAVYNALAHATLSMFVTSATTAAAFYANLISDVMVVKCFGIFAGTLILVHYFLVITFLPAAILCKYQYINPLFRLLARSLRRTCYLDAIAVVLEFLATDVCPVEKILNPVFEKLLPWVMKKLKYFLIIFFGGFLIASIVLIFYKPGFALPERNPLQLFRSSHPFEWYDNNVAALFPFKTSSANNHVYYHILWGFEERTQNMDHFDPASYGDLIPKSGFNFNSIAAIENFTKVCESLQNQPFVTKEPVHERCWTKRYLEYAENSRCYRRAPDQCCNHQSEIFNESNLPFCLNRSSQILSHYWDGPIFRNGTVVGYLQEVEAAFRYSPIYEKLHTAFTGADDGLNAALQNKSLGIPMDSSFRDAWLVTGFKYSTIWYDLLHSLTHGTPVSVGVSVSVAFLVVIITTRTFVISLLSIITISGVIVSTLATLVLLQWRINIIEATIIILTVGLSFDFTLHYAVAFKLSPSGPLSGKVEAAFKFIGIPVFLSALTTFIAGLAMIPSESQAFYQIGAFMMLVTGNSWIFSTLFMMSLLAVFGPQHNGCCSVFKTAPEDDATRERKESESSQNDRNSSIISNVIRPSKSKPENHEHKNGRSSGRKVYGRGKDLAIISPASLSETERLKLNVFSQQLPEVRT